MIAIAQVIKEILRKEPFYGLFLLGLNKRFDNCVETAAVVRSGINVELVINEEFWKSLKSEQCEAIILHEMHHILLGHLTMSEYFPNKQKFNYAADCQVNSFISNLPDNAVTPDKFGFESEKGTKWYYEHIPDEMFPELSLMDSHDWKNFEDLSDAEKQLINNQIGHLVKQSAQEVLKGQGNIPAQYKEYVDNLLKKRPPVFNWKSYFRRLLGSVQDIELKKTRKRESNRFPGASGLKHKKKSNICIIVDTSASVSNEELQDFFTEINYIWRAGTDITIIENDAAIQRIYKYNGKWDGSVSGRGGTVFAECVDWYNEHFRDFNTIIFFTDGFAKVDYKIIGQVIWVITSNGCKQKYPGKTIYIPKN